MCRFSWSNEGDGSKVGFGKSPLPPLFHPHLSPQPITSPHLSLTWPGLEQLWCRLRGIGCKQRAQIPRNVEEQPADFTQRSQKVGRRWLACWPEGYKCHDGQCIPAERRCDKRDDCSQGEDEQGCDMHCGLDEFVCKDRGCAKQNAVCDGVPDCEDGSDEMEHCHCYLRGKFACRFSFADL